MGWPEELADDLFLMQPPVVDHVFFFSFSAEGIILEWHDG